MSNAGETPRRSRKKSTKQPDRKRSGSPGAKRGKRAFAAIDRGGKSGYVGPRDVGRDLERALVPAAATRTKIAGELTHGFHSYPARMHPATARAAIAGMAPRRLVDPFCGSGTTLVEARAAGIEAVGTDINPLALAIGAAKTFTVPKRERTRLVRLAQTIAAEAVAAGKEARRSAGKEARKRRKPDALSKWFPPHVYPEVRFLESRIGDVEDEEVASVLRTALSAILHKVSLRASDSDGRQVQRSIARGAAARFFADRVRDLAFGLEQLGKRRGPRPRFLLADARKLTTAVVAGSFDAVLTSPPYAATYDYAIHHELRIAFFGHAKASLKSEIGSRESFARLDFARALGTWQKDLAASLGQMELVLKPGGTAAVVLGDSITGRRAIRALTGIERAIESTEMSLDAYAWQDRPPVSGAERQAFSSQPKREYLFLLRRA